MKIKCLFRHKWTKWESDINAKWMARRCYKCGHTERKRVIGG